MWGHKWNLDEWEIVKTWYFTLVLKVSAGIGIMPQCYGYGSCAMYDHACVLIWMDGETDQNRGRNRRKNE